MDVLYKYDTITRDSESKTFKNKKSYIVSDKKPILLLSIHTTVYIVPCIRHNILEFWVFNALQLCTCSAL